MTVSRCGRKWGTQDGGGCGHVIEDAHDRDDGWVRVQWLADGGTNGYRWGAQDCYDLTIVDAAAGTTDRVFPVALMQAWCCMCQSSSQRHVCSWRQHTLSRRAILPTDGVLFSFCRLPQ